MSAFLAAPRAHALARSPAERATCAPRSALRARRVVSVRAAADEGFSPAALKNKYDELSQSVPPLLTAAAVPVIALSLLCKAATGSGLPGALGLVEGLSYLALPFGLPNFLPRVGEIVQGGDFSSAAVLAILSRDVRGESASERVARITAVTDPNSALGMQLADLEKARKINAGLTAEQLQAKKKWNSEIALAAINGVGKGISKADLAKADAVGREALLAQPVAETMAAGMTVENFGTDVTKLTDEELAGRNLSSPELRKASAHE